MLEDYKVIYHAQLAPSFFNPSNPFRGGVYSFGAYFAGKSDVRDHYDMSQNGGVNLSDFIVGLNWSDSVNAPYSNATITLKIPDDLQNYYLPGTKPFKTSGQIKYQDIMFNQRSNPLANFFFKQMKTGAWITIHHPLLKSERSDEKVYPACFFGKLSGISYSIISDELGQTTYTNITLQCESFIQTMIESQFRVRMSEDSLGILQESAAIQRRSGGTPSQQSAQTGTYGASQWIGSLPPNNLMSVTEWINYILNPLIALSNSNKSLGYLFEKFSKLFAAQMVPQSVITPQPVEEGSIRGGSRTRVLADCFIVNYSNRHSIGTKWEDYFYSLGQATNFKAVGSAVGKSSIWRWLLDTFAVDSATIECFPLLVAPKGSTKEQRDQQVSRLIRNLVSTSSRSNYAQAKLPQSRIDIISQGPPTEGSVRELNELGMMLQATEDVARFAQMITPDNPFPDFSGTIGEIDGLLMRRGNPVVFNEFDNDIIKAIVIRDMYLALGVIPTIFYRLKPLAPGMTITKNYMASASVENSPLQQPVGSASQRSKAEEMRYFETASEKVAYNEYEEGTRLTRYDRAFAEGPKRTVENYALIDSDYWLGASFNYSEARRVNGIFFDSVFTSADDTLFSLDALEVVPNPIIDSEDVKKDGFRVYEGSFPFLQTPTDYTPGTPLTDDQRKQMLALPQAMAERAFMLLGKDHEYSSGVISLVYHDNWDITPGIYGILSLGDYKLPKDLEDFEGYKRRKRESEAEALAAEMQNVRELYEEDKATHQLVPANQTWEEYWGKWMRSEEEGVHVTGKREKGIIPDDKFFEFYIDSVDREVTVDQETGKVSGMIHITYSRGSIGRKQNLFRYHDFALDSSMEQ